MHCGAGGWGLSGQFQGLPKPLRCLLPDARNTAGFSVSPRFRTVVLPLSHTDIYIPIHNSGKIAVIEVVTKTIVQLGVTTA